MRKKQPEKLKSLKADQITQLFPKNPGLIVEPANFKFFTMSVTLRTNLGFTEAVLADDGTLNLFYHIAHIVSNDLKIRFLNKEDEFDSLNWNFKYKGQAFTLHYNIYNGISIVPAATKDTTRNNKVLTEMAGLVERRMEAGSRLKRTA